MSQPKVPPKWQRFEDLVAHIQSTLAPGATVERNVKVTGRSGLPRQIDISVRTKVGQFDLFLVIDCKDYNGKVDVNDVEAVSGLCQDVGANQGAIVAARGFTGGAVKRAKSAGVNLYTLIDAEKHEWQTLVTIPILLGVRSLESVAFQFSNSSPGPFSLSMHDIEHPLGLAIFSADGVPQGTLEDLLRERWNQGALPNDAGEHGPVRITSDEAHTRTDGTLYRIDVDARILVGTVRYFKQVPLAEVQGFKDEVTGAIHTNRMVTERIDLASVESTWQRIESTDSLAVEPVIIRNATDPSILKPPR